MSPLFVDIDIFSESVVGVHIFKSKVVLDKPVYIAGSVQECYKCIFSKNEFKSFFHSYFDGGYFDVKEKL